MAESAVTASGARSRGRSGRGSASRGRHPPGHRLRRLHVDLLPALPVGRQPHEHRPQLLRHRHRRRGHDPRLAHRRHRPVGGLESWPSAASSQPSPRRSSPILLGGRAGAVIGVINGRSSTAPQAGAVHRDAGHARRHPRDRGHDERNVSGGCRASSRPSARATSDRCPSRSSSSSSPRSSSPSSWPFTSAGHLYLLDRRQRTAAAILTGLPVARVKIFVYVTCGVLSALAGILVVSRVASLPGQSLGYELQVIAAAVIGGVNSTAGGAPSSAPSSGPMLIRLIQNALVFLRVPPLLRRPSRGGFLRPLPPSSTS